MIRIKIDYKIIVKLYVLRIRCVIRKGSVKLNLNQFPKYDQWFERYVKPTHSEKQRKTRFYIWTIIVWSTKIMERYFLHGFRLFSFLRFWYLSNAWYILIDIINGLPKSYEFLGVCIEFFVVYPKSTTKWLRSVLKGPTDLVYAT